MDCVQLHMEDIENTVHYSYVAEEMDIAEIITQLVTWWFACYKPKMH